jgi:thioredoxin-related protein
MGKQLLLLLLLLFSSCSQNEEQKNTRMNINAIKTMPNINSLYSNYNEAFQEAKKSNKPVFILFTTRYCRWCKKLKETTLKEQEIINRLNSEFIVILLDKNHSEYPSKYKVSAVPTVYITDKNEEIFTSIVGYHKNPHDYIKWFDYVKIELSN